MRNSYARAEMEVKQSDRKSVCIVFDKISPGVIITNLRVQHIKKSQ